MNSKVLNIIFLFIVSFISTGGVSADKIPITIFHVNDTHGHAWSELEDGRSVGGFAALSFLIKKKTEEVKKQGGIILKLHAGDINTGTPESDLLRAKPDLTALEHMGFQASAIGNHEFDKGLSSLVEQMQGTTLPFLAANLKFPDPYKKFNRAYRTFEEKGLRIGVLGLTTDGLPNLLRETHLAGTKVSNPVESAKEWIPKMKAEGNNVLIVLSHVGVYEDGKTADEVEIAKAVPEIDAIIGGHTHTLMPKGRLIGKTLLSQAGWKNRQLGVVTLIWDPDSRSVVERRAETFNIRPEDGEDLVLKEKLLEQRRSIEPLFNKPLAHASDKILGRQSPTCEWPLGNLLMDFLKRDTGADVALFNTKGIRGDLEKGSVSLGKLLSIFPFPDTVRVVEVKGVMLRQIMENACAMPKDFLYQMSGMSVLIDKGRCAEIKVNGKDIVANQTYKLATTDYVINVLNKNLSELATPSVSDRDGMNLIDILQRQFELEKELVPKFQGRIASTDTRCPPVPEKTPEGASGIHSKEPKLRHPMEKLHIQH